MLFLPYTHSLTKKLIFNSYDFFSWYTLPIHTPRPTNKLPEKNMKLYEDVPKKLCQEIVQQTENPEKRTQKKRKYSSLSEHRK
jgi:1-acyl-sn-glycerol-3-phosphate acyltransferase